MMKVLLVSPLPPPSGGMARWTQLYLSICNRHGIEASVVNTNLSKKRANRMNRSFTFGDEIKRSIRIIKDLDKKIKSEKPDIIHICSPCSKIGVIRDLLCVLKARKIPVVFHCHCNIEDQAKSKISQIILHKIVKKSKKIIVLNSKSKKIIDSIEMNKAIIIPNFIEDGKVYLKHNISKKINSILYVGHVKLKKGIKEIYKVAMEFTDKTFIVVGPVQELPEDIKTPKNVKLIGEVNHDLIESYMEKADVFLFPSYTEGFANVMLEAMASGLPIIASDVGANKDMIGSFGGIIVPVKDCKAIKNAINIIENPEVRYSMSSWNTERVKSNYTLSTIIPILKNCYGECI